MTLIGVLDPRSPGRHARLARPIGAVGNATRLVRSTSAASRSRMRSDWSVRGLVRARPWPRSRDRFRLSDGERPVIGSATEGSRRSDAIGVPADDRF